MSKDKTHLLTEEILASIQEEVNDFLAIEDQITSSIAYEEKVLEIARKFAANLISGAKGQLPRDRNAKKKS